MLDLIGAPENAPFSIALVVMMGIALVEGVLSLAGAGLSGLIDSLVADADLDADLDPGLELDGDADLHTHASGHHVMLDSGFLSQTMAWLHFGKVPLLMLGVIFLTAFGLIGLAGQSAFRSVTGHYLPAGIAWLPALLAALPMVRAGGGLLARILPKEETSAVSQQSFVGRIATIVIGTAGTGAPAQARLVDAHGRSHYVMVEPDVEGQRFESGTPVLLVRIDGPRFRCIRPPSDALLEVGTSS